LVVKQSARTVIALKMDHPVNGTRWRQTMQYQNGGQMTVANRMVGSGVATEQRCDRQTPEHHCNGTDLKAMLPAE
jgi:hypothetical protein